MPFFFHCSAVLLVRAVATRVVSVAPDLFRYAASIGALAEVIPGAEGIAVQRLVAPIAVWAVDEAVTEERPRDAGASQLAAVLVGRTQAVLFVRIVPAIDNAIAAFADRQTRGGVATAKVCPRLESSALTVALVARIVAIRVSVTPVRVGDTLAIPALPLVQVATYGKERQRGATKHQKLWLENTANYRELSIT